MPFYGQAWINSVGHPGLSFPKTPQSANSRQGGTCADRGSLGSSSSPGGRAQREPVRAVGAARGGRLGSARYGGPRLPPAFGPGVGLGWGARRHAAADATDSPGGLVRSDLPNDQERKLE